MVDEKLAELTELTVKEQADKLGELTAVELEELQRLESRKTALSNIEDALDAMPVEKDGVEEDVESEEDDGVSAQYLIDDMDNVTLLEKKVDYVFEKAKTVSVDGFEAWMENHEEGGGQ